MGHKVIEVKNFRWHHISHVGDSDLEYLQENFKFHHLDYEDIRSDTPISKMDPYKHYIFFIFHIPVTDKDRGHIVGEELYVFLSKDELVTAGHVSHKPLEYFFERMQKSSKFRASVLSKGTAYLMYRLLTEEFRFASKIVSNLAVEVTRLEEEIQHKHQKRITVELGHARRNALFLRHIIEPQRNMLTSLANTKRPFIQEESLLYIDDLQDILDNMSLTSDNLKLIVEGLFDVNEALLSHKTNEIVTLLTIISASLMVPTLIAGFYGMNVDWLPFAANPAVVGILYLVGFVGMVLVVSAIMRRPRR